MDEIKLQILKYNYWEHFKIAKDLSLVLPVGHPRRKKIEEELNKLQLQINKDENI